MRWRRDLSLQGLCYATQDLPHVHNVWPGTRVHVCNVLWTADLHTPKGPVDWQEVSKSIHPVREWVSNPPDMTSEGPFAQVPCQADRLQEPSTRRR